MSRTVFSSKLSHARRGRFENNMKQTNNRIFNFITFFPINKSNYLSTFADILSRTDFIRLLTTLEFLKTYTPFFVRKQFFRRISLSQQAVKSFLTAYKILIQYSSDSCIVAKVIFLIKHLIYNEIIFSHYGKTNFRRKQ